MRHLAAVAVLLVGCQNDPATGQATGAKTGAKTGAEAFAEAAKSMGSAIIAANQPDVTGTVHSAGGEIGTWDITLADCQSGEVNGFFGVDFSATGSDDLRLRYVHDEAAGEIVKVMIPSKKGTARVFDREAKCAVLEGSIEKTNVTTWTPKGRIRHVSGHVKFDCAETDGTGHVTGEATFSHCH